MLCGLSAIENGLNLSKFREQEAFCLDNAIKYNISCISNSPGAAVQCSVGGQGTTTQHPP